VHLLHAARFAGPALVLVLFGACDKPSAPNGSGAGAKAPEAPVPASCAWDEDCKNDKYICMYEKCVKGERSPEAKAAIAAQRKADEEKAKAKAEADRPPGPGEGKLTVRICPFVKKTGQFTAQVTAKSKATGQSTTLVLEDLIDFGGHQSEFVFRKLPVGDYEVTADYGVKVGAKRDVVTLECDKGKNGRQPCAKDKQTRLMTVVPIGQEPPPKIDKDGKVEKKPCDWTAQ
jgi:hypothetical protein